MLSNGIGGQAARSTSRFPAGQNPTAKGSAQGGLEAQSRDPQTDAQEARVAKRIT